MSLPADNYIITRNAGEGERLELQHRMTISCQGYYLHPDISVPSSARIGEVCTGTAIWLREVAAANSSAECHGFDLSDAMYPSQDKLPTNVKLHLADIKKPFEDRWLGYFDVVHIRLIAAAMRVEEWGPAVRNVVTLLKPGGWLQWVEDDRPVAVRHTFRPVAPVGAAEKSLQNSADWRPPPPFTLGRFVGKTMTNERAEAMNYAYMNLDKLMADPALGNLDQVACDAFTIDREDDGGKFRKAWAMMGITADWNMASAVEAAGQKIIDMDEFEYRERSMRDVGMGAYWVVRATVFIGRKKEN